MRIGELAKRAGVTTDTIRYYERVGLLAAPTRGQNRYREYGLSTVEDVEFVKKAQILGLKLSEIVEVLEITAGGQPPCEHVRSVVAQHLVDVERKIHELRALRSTLKDTLRRLEIVPEHVTGCRCAVIEAG